MTSQTSKDEELPFDANSDRPAELDELNFNDPEEPSFQSIASDEELDAFAMQNDEFDDEDSTNDDLTPENLIPDDGARSPYEPGGSIPADEILTIVNEDEIGEGYGLDEAELARVDPLDGKPE